jgi:hypothetical protein
LFIIPFLLQGGIVLKRIIRGREKRGLAIYAEQAEDEDWRTA